MCLHPLSPQWVGPQEVCLNLVKQEAGPFQQIALSVEGMPHHLTLSKYCHLHWKGSLTFSEAAPSLEDNSSELYEEKKKITVSFWKTERIGREGGYEKGRILNTKSMQEKKKEGRKEREKFAVHKRDKQEKEGIKTN